MATRPDSSRGLVPLLAVTLVLVVVSAALFAPVFPHAHSERSSTSVPAANVDPSSTVPIVRAQLARDLADLRAAHPGWSIAVADDGGDPPQRLSLAMVDHRVFGRSSYTLTAHLRGDGGLEVTVAMDAAARRSLLDELRRVSPVDEAVSARLERAKTDLVAAVDRSAPPPR